MLSTAIPLGPAARVALGRLVKGALLLRTTTQPSEGPLPGAVQSAVKPKKKKSVPPTPMVGLKTSVQPVQWAGPVDVEVAVVVMSCAENDGTVCIMGGVAVLKPKAYCHGFVSAAPVPHSRTNPVDGFVK